MKAIPFIVYKRLLLFYRWCFEALVPEGSTCIVAANRLNLIYKRFMCNDYQAYLLNSLSFLWSIITLVTLFQAMWISTIHHVVGEHQWETGSCPHGILNCDQTREYLEPGSTAHNKLIHVLLDQTFLHRVEYYLNCRWTFLKDFSLAN